MKPQPDEPRGVRAGEEIDADKLAEAAGLIAPVEVKQFPGGHSNLTYLVRAADGRELVLRRPPFGNRVATAHDMGREHTILSRLCEVYRPAPRPVFFCEDAAVIGAPFYLMERVHGVVLRRTLPDGVALDAVTIRRAGEALVDALAALHAVDWRSAGLTGIARPAGYVERQVRGWTKRYRDAQTSEVQAMDRVATWLLAHLPDATASEARATVVHNDYKFDNVVLGADDLTRVEGVLDWEMSTIGDPLMDLGVALGYWVEAGDPDDVKMLAFGPTLLPGSLTRREVVERYAKVTGLDTSLAGYFYVFALFKSAGVLQQIFWRHQNGFTKDERFATFDQLVALLAARAEFATHTPVI